MSDIIVYENGYKESRKDSLNKSNSSRSKVWIVQGSNDLDECVAAVKTSAPTTLTTVTGETLIRTGLNPKATGPISAEVEVEYSAEDSEKSKDDNPPDGEELKWELSFDTTGGTHKIYQSKENVWRGSNSDGTLTAPDLKGGIGWDGKNLQGVEIFVGKLEFSIKIYYPREMIGVAFLQTLGAKTPSVNVSPWLGFSAGTLLFLGATGTGEILTLAGTRTKPFPVTLKFAYSDNQTDIRIGSITVPSKKGWHYLSIQYKKVEVDGLLIPTPLFAWVDKIYDEYDFGIVFGFGG